MRGACGRLSTGGAETIACGGSATEPGGGMSAFVTAAGISVREDSTGGAIAAMLGRGAGTCGGAIVGACDCWTEGAAITVGAGPTGGVTGNG